MATYNVLAGQTVSDAILNSCGDISAWDTFLVANDFASWTPDLYSGQVLQVPADAPVNIDNIAALKNYPANNFSVPDIDEQIDTIFGILAGAMSGISPVIQPSIIDTNTYYTVRFGEGITDVVLNATGNIANWDVITQANNWEWDELLYSGQVVTIPANVVMNLNNFRSLNTYPANNFSVPDIYIQINAIFDLLNNPVEDFILYDPDGYWNDISHYWRDQARWLD